MSFKENKTYRQKYRITPDEEDLLAKKIKEVFLNMVNLKVDDYSKTLIDYFLNIKYISGNEIEMTYNWTANAGLIEAWLGEIRNKKKVVKKTKKK